MSENANDRIRELLTEWALWQMQLQGVGLRGARIAAHVKIPGGGEDGNPEPTAEVHRVELVLAHVKQMMPLYWRVVRIQYLVKLSNQEAADELRMSVAGWKVLRGNAEIYIAGCMDMQAYIETQNSLTQGFDRLAALW